MQTRHVTLALGALALAAASFAADAAIVFQNLGSSAPPSSLGGHAMTPFSTSAQASVTENASVSAIPGNPFAGQLSISPDVNKYTLQYTWGSDPWPGSYVGPIWFTGWSVTSRTLTLPPGTTAFYFYVQNNSDGNPADTITVTANSGVTSGPVLVQTGFWNPNVGANGFAFYSTAGETITSITVSTDNSTGFALGIFGISGGSAAPTVTCASSGYTGTKLTWCQNVCEKGYTGATLDMWIHRWIGKYRDLPYCMQEETPPPPPPAE